MGEKEKTDEGIPGKKLPYPKQIFFILSTEACERFSFYGMRTILAIYLKHLFQELNNWDTKKAEDTATIIYHTFNFLCYLTPLIGATLADSFFGKFKTIFWISIVYAIGQGVLSLGAIPNANESSSGKGIAGMPQQAISYIGLFLIAFGTGGIKPCVVSFGADQFKVPEQQAQMATYFMVFYASINFGSMLSTILTPIIRRTQCFEEDCFSLAFGIPAVLMAIAIVFFGVGGFMYKKKNPERNVVLDFIKCLWAGIKGKLSSKGAKRDHWLDYAEPRWGAEFVSEVKAVMRVGKLFLLYPIFWALFDQQSSRWTFQATRMNGRIGSLNILPDQLQVVNAVLILVFIPMFDRVVYPLLGKCNLLKTPLQRIVTGGMLAALSFCVSAVVESQLQKTYPERDKATYPGDSLVIKDPRYGLDIYDGTGCGLKLKLNDEELEETRLAVEDAIEHHLEWEVDPTKPCDLDFEGNFEDRFNLTLGARHTYYFMKRHDNKLSHGLTKNADQIDKAGDGLPVIRYVWDLPEDTVQSNGTLFQLYKGDKRKEMFTYELGSASGDSYVDPDDVGDSTTSDQGKKMEFCFDPLGESFEKEKGKRCTEDTSCVCLEQEIDLAIGGVYQIYVTAVPDTNQKIGYKPVISVQEVVEHNTMHMAWLLPQFAIITAGEILFSITSLAFSFTQAPESMKAVLQALYLLTTGTGNLIDLAVVAIFEGVFSSQVYEFLFFAGLMVLNMLVLAWLAVKYEYVDYTSEGQQAPKTEDNGDLEMNEKKLKE